MSMCKRYQIENQVYDERHRCRISKLALKIVPANAKSVLTAMRYILCKGNLLLTFTLVITLHKDNRGAH